MFGAEVKMSFQKRQYHGTCWGVFFTSVMYITIVFATLYYGEDLVYRKSPQTTYSQENVAHPERYYFTPQSFTAAFGIEDSQTWNHIIDPTIYSVKALNRKRFKKLNSTSYEYFFEEHVLDLLPQVCNLNEFEVANTQQYFEELAGIKNMYCFSYSNSTDTNKDSEDLNSVYIEGDYTSDVFAQIEIAFYSCKNKTQLEIEKLQSQGLPVITCKSQSEIDLHLQNAYIGMYLTTQNFDPNNFKKPFSNAGTDLFWPVSNSLSKYISLFYKNTYISSNQGLLFDDVVIQKGFQLASDKEQLTLPVDNQFAYINIRFQKGLQDRIFRHYKSIGAVIAQIGGIATFMRIIGFIVAFPISKLNLRKNIINELFSFQDDTNANEDNKKQNLKQIQQIQQITIKNESQNYPNSQFNFKNKVSQTFTDIKSKDKLVENIQAGHDQQQKNLYEVNKNNFQQIKCKFEGKQHQSLSQIDQKQDQGENFCQELTDQMRKQRSISNLTKQIEMQQGISDFNQKQVNRKKYQSLTIQGQSQNNQTVEILNQKIDDNFKDTLIKNNNDITNDNQNYYDQLFDTNKQKMDLSFSDSVLYYLFPCPRRIKVKKNKIDFCNQIISEQLDGVYIIKKLLELEKLKAILLSEDQLKIFEYIPKPNIDDDLVSNYSQKKQDNQFHNLKNEKQLTNSDKLAETNLLKFSCSPKTNQNNLNPQNLLNLNSFNILKLQPKTEEQKSKEAFIALKKICQKENLSKIDMKILKLIDPTLQLHALNSNFFISNYNNNNTDSEEKKSDFSHFGIINQRISNQTEPINLNENENKEKYFGILNKTLPNNISNQFNNFKINKISQVQKSRVIAQYPEESIFPLEINSQQNSYFANNEQFSEFNPEIFVQTQNIDASAAKLYTMNFLLPFKRFSTNSPTKKQNSLAQMSESC